MSRSTRAAGPAVGACWSRRSGVDAKRLPMAGAGRLSIVDADSLSIYGWMLDMLSMVDACVEAVRG